MKVNIKVCPDCGKDDFVMGLRVGSLNIYGCLNCRNAQGFHVTAKSAKEAFEKYAQAKQPKAKS